jgi:zinc transporter ZupT
VTTPVLILIVLAAVSFLGAAAGVWFAAIPDVSRKMIPLSGALLAAISIFWVLPELAETFGWAAGTGLMLTGVAVIAAFDRYVHPICPACAHDHNHDACGTRLHGFASPLIIAALLHSLFDGWTFAAGWGDVHSQSLSFGVAIHKLPEGIALGVILRAALKSRRNALAWAAVTQLATIVGGIFEITAAEQLGQRWITLLLAIGGGMFLYLGAHAMHGEWKRRAAHREAQIG